MSKKAVLIINQPSATQLVCFMLMGDSKMAACAMCGQSLIKVFALRIKSCVIMNVVAVICFIRLTEKVRPSLERVHI